MINIKLDLNKSFSDFINWMQQPSTLIALIFVLIILIAITFGLLYFVRKL